MEPRAQRKRFYDALFRECSEAQVNVRAIHRVKDEYTLSDFIPLATLLDGPLETFVRKWGSNKDYIGLYHAIASRNGGGKKEHIVEIPALWVDMDFKNVPEEEAIKRLGEFHFMPSAVVESGGGLHIYWFLKEPATKADIPQVEKVLKQLVAVLGADYTPAQAAAILRIPGTVNRKYEEPRDVKLVYCHPDKRYNLEDISDCLPEVPDYQPEPLIDYERSREVDRVMQCRFLVHCDLDRATLPEPQWYCMISNLARCQGGPSRIHELSIGYPGYSREETNNKILHAINAANPHTCNYIKRLWDCGKNCGVKAPAGLVSRITTQKIKLARLTPEDTSILEFLLNKPPERKYYLREILPRGIIGNLSARGGSSKGFLVIALSIGLAIGEEVLGFEPTKPVKVLALFGEDPRQELHARIHFTAHTLFPDMYEDILQLLSKNFHAVSVAGDVGGLMGLVDGNPVPTERYEWLCETIEAHENLELLIIDPKSRFYGLDENNNDHNTAWITCLEGIRSKYGVDVLFTHHVSQSQGDKLTQTAARGGTALIDGLRWAANIRTLSKTEGDKFDLEDHRRYIEFDVTKNNYAPMLPQSRYFKRGPEGVLLPVDLRMDKLERITKVLLEMCKELYDQQNVRYNKRELWQRTEGKELREKTKEIIPCTNKDISNAIEYALKNKLAEMVAIPEKKNREEFHVLDTST